MSLDRSAIERVLARAAELQSQHSAEPTGGLSDAQVLELGKEVGLSAEALQQAMAEERGRVVGTSPRGVAGAWFGHSQYSATRVVAGTPQSVLAALDAHLRGELPFEVKRRFPDRLMWEPKGGFLDGVRMTLGVRAEGGDLVLAEEVSALVVAVDGARTHVRLDASIAGRRRNAARASAVVAGGSAFAAWALAALSVSPVVTLTLAGSVAALGLLVPKRNYAGTAERVELALFQVLDRLEYGPAKRKSAAAGFVDKLLGPDGLGGL
jgi:hypothetical protein